MSAQTQPASPLVGNSRAHYQRHQPEHTLLYQLVERHYPTFNYLMAKTERPLPDFVQQEFEAYLKCGRLEHGFLRVQCESCKHEDLVAFSCKKRGFCPSCGAKRMVEHAALLVDDVLPLAPYRQWVLSVPFQLRFLFASYPELMSKALGIVYRTIATHLIHAAGHTHDTAHTGAITFIQRFGSALNLNVHFHMLFLDGVYVAGHGQQQRFQQVNAPSKEQLQSLVQNISERLAKLLTRKGLLTQDEDSAYLSLDALDDNALQHLQGASITYRVAVGPQQGKKVFTLQTIPAKQEEDDRFSQVGKVSGFSLHAAVATQAYERQKLERICRYIARPAVSEQRLSLTKSGNVRYELKTPYRDGTTHVIFEPLDFIAKLAALVPKPRVNLTRYHGVFAPNSAHRALITPSKRGKGGVKEVTTATAIELLDDKSYIEKRAAMTWAQRLKRVFNIEIEICRHCQGPVKIIAYIEDLAVIEKILSHLNSKANAGIANQTPLPLLPMARAPPEFGAGLWPEGDEGVHH
jgi:ribosomal protein S27E